MRPPLRGLHSRRLFTSSSSPSPCPRPCTLLSLSGLTDYDTAWRYQKVLLEHANSMQKQQVDVPDSLLLVEHPRILTLGRGATLANIKPRPAFESSDSGATSYPRVVRIERGGEVTWHGPGQLVAYPIVNLSQKPHRKDLHWYTSMLEESVIRALGACGIEAHRSPVNTGVWVGTHKIAAVGVSASRWFTFHGVCINVSPMLDDYDLIIPCGVTEPGHGVTSIAQEFARRKSQQQQQEVTLEEFKSLFAASFEKSFQVALQPPPLSLSAFAHVETLLCRHPALALSVPSLPL